MSKLLEVEGIGPVFAERLSALGLETTEQLLAAAGSADGPAKLAEVNAAKHLVRRLPTEPEIEGWIASAKTLPKAVGH